MYSYKNIPIWTNIKRQKILGEFRNNVGEYFQNCRAENGIWIGETTRALERRKEINLQYDEAYSAIIGALINPVILYAPPEGTSGWRGQLDLMSNIFMLEMKRVHESYLIDMIDRAIGVYKSNRRNAIIRTFNPLFWFLMIVDFVVSIPFIILGRIGFNQKKMEQSKIGKLIKLVFYLILLIEAILVILQRIGHDDWIKNILAPK